MPRPVLGQGGWVPAAPPRSQLQQETVLLAPLLGTSRGGRFSIKTFSRWQILHKEMIPKGLPLERSQEQGVYNSSIL